MNAAIATESGFDLPSTGGGEVLLWLLLAGGIVGLYFVISRTRKRSYRAYMSKTDREAELKSNDPDMKRDS
ncbi:MAG: LPXTG cell wall anchor domain-containing protein [Acidimicrobiia bacterium]